MNSELKWNRQTIHIHNLKFHISINMSKGHCHGRIIISRHFQLCLAHVHYSHVYPCTTLLYVKCQSHQHLIIIFLHSFFACSHINMYALHKQNMVNVLTTSQLYQLIDESTNKSWFYIFYTFSNMVYMFPVQNLTSFYEYNNICSVSTIVK